MKRALCLFLFLVAIAPAVGRANVVLPNVIGSNMVLQRDAALPIWGWAEPGEEVTVTLGADNKATATADAAGRWQVKLAPVKAGGPLEMTVAGKNTLKLTNILIGEVWVGSGQSNMEWSVSASANPQEEISAATYPKIRLFLVPKVPSGTPARDVNARWVECSPATAPSFSAVSYFFGRELQKQLDVPVGLIATSWGGTRIEPWIPPVGFASEAGLDKEAKALEGARQGYQKLLMSNVGLVREWLAAADKAVASGGDVPDMPQMPAHPLNGSGASTGLYNGMIHPIAPFAIRGALWYQGESNVGAGMHYFDLMKGLIGGWRKVWNQGDFPFLFVQLAPFKYGNAKETNLPEIWEAQTASLAVPNTGMCVTTDISTIGNIHPPNKQEVGRRLALWALANTYGKKDLVYSGPLYDSMAVELDQIKIKFKHADGGLKSRDDKPLSWFTIAGEDQKFVPATAKIEGNAVVVSSAQVPAPVAVRFGWNQIAEPNLANQAGLPASPFRTDKWDGAALGFPGEKK